MSIDALFDRIHFQCTCCGALSRGGREHTCDCWSGRIDRCEATGACAEHCRCRRCHDNRVQGYERVNWTGTRHFARAHDHTTLCGRPIGGPPIWRAPMLRPSGTDECRICTRRFPATPHPQRADPCQ